MEYGEDKGCGFSRAGGGEGEDVGGGVGEEVGYDLFLDGCGCFVAEVVACLLEWGD